MSVERRNTDRMRREVRQGGGGAAVVAFAVLHLICCGIPLLLLSGVSLAFLVPSWPVIGIVLAVLGVVGFIWYLKRGCATCPRNEGRCMGGACQIEDHPPDWRPNASDAGAGVRARSQSNH